MGKLHLPGTHVKGQSDLMGILPRNNCHGLNPAMGRGGCFLFYLKRVRDLYMHPAHTMISSAYGSGG